MEMEICRNEKEREIEKKKCENSSKSTTNVAA